MASTSNLSPPAESLTRNWLELPPEVMATILHRLGAIEILLNAQKVCTGWRRICKDPAMWRVIDTHYSGDHWEVEFDLKKNICKHAVDLSDGQLVDINIEYFGTDELLEYISLNSSQLRRLRVVCCNDISSDGLCAAVKKLPLLEELHLYYTSISKEAIETIGFSCPKLKSFKMNDNARYPLIDSDEEVLAISKSMPELRHLQLFGNNMTNDGLLAILDGCPHLESLDLRQCFNVNLTGNLGKRCSEQIKFLRRPNDSTEDYGFDTEIHDCDSYDEDYPSGFSDIDLLSNVDDYYDFSGNSDFEYGYDEPYYY